VWSGHRDPDHRDHQPDALVRREVGAAGRMSVESHPAGVRPEHKTGTMVVVSDRA